MHIREVGNLAREVEAKEVTVTRNGEKVQATVVNNTIAINYFAGGKERTKFLQFSLWDQDAEKLLRMVKNHDKNGKGKAFLVSGYVYDEEYESNGEKRKTDKIDVEFFDYPPRGFGNSGKNNNSSSSSTTSKTNTSSNSTKSGTSDTPATKDPNIDELDAELEGIDIDDVDLDVSDIPDFE